MGLLVEELQGIGTTVLSGDTTITGDVNIEGSITIGATTYQYVDGPFKGGWNLPRASVNTIISGATTDLQFQDGTYYIWNFDIGIVEGVYVSGFTQSNTLTISGIFPTTYNTEIWINESINFYEFLGSGTYETIELNIPSWVAWVTYPGTGYPSPNEDNISIQFRNDNFTSTDQVSLDYIGISNLSDNYLRTSNFNFDEMLDTPSSYLGETGKYVSVNTSEDGLEFVTGGVDGTSGTSGLDGISGTSGLDGSDGPFGGLTASWKWSGTTQYSEDPGTNYLNLDSDESQYAEGIYISNLDYLNEDQSNWILNMQPGNRIRITYSNNQYMDLNPIISVANNSTWVKVSMFSGGTMVNGPFDGYWPDDGEVWLSYIIVGNDGISGTSGTSGVDGVATLSGITTDTDLSYDTNTDVLSTPKLILTTDPGAASVLQMYNTSGVLYDVTIVGSTLTLSIA